MAIIKKGVLHGGVSNIVYRTYRGQQIAQLKPSKVKQSLSSKEAGLEFGLCCNTAAAMRVFLAGAYSACEGRMINRFNSAVRKSFSGSAKARGERDIHDAELSFLRGFQFNANSPLSEVLRGRPVAELNSENRVVLHLPALAASEVKCPRADEYRIRLLGWAFDFKAALCRRVICQEIPLTWTRPIAAGSIIFDEALPEGRLLILTMSVHAYVRNFIEGLVPVNSLLWSPAELIGAWQLPQGAGPEAEKEGTDSDVPEAHLDYCGKAILKQMAELRAGMVGKSSEAGGILGRKK